MKTIQVRNKTTHTHKQNTQKEFKKKLKNPK